MAEGGRGAQEYTTSVLTRRQRMNRIWDLWTRGCTNKVQIAAALHCTVGEVTRDMKALLRGWLRETRLSMEKKRAFRIQQLSAIAYVARHAFDESREPQEELVVTKAPCRVCEGGGQLWSRIEQEMQECPGCEGACYQTTRTKKVKTSTGDGTFLNIAKSAVVEMARLEGHYLGKVDPVTGQPTPDITLIGQINQSINIEDGGPNPFAEADPMMVVQAKAVLARLLEGRAAEAGDGMAVPVVYDALPQPEGGDDADYSVQE